ncbi:MAG: PD-(D/E)XK nuclease superfamily protein [Cyanobacteriota bacterium]|nr:PD-(D/E)XK nuclease superfamily protein [Cyanobacteriota bacterium]
MDDISQISIEIRGIMQPYGDLKGEELKHEVCRILDALGLYYKTEEYSAHGSSIIGKRRRVDVVIVDGFSNPIMHVECKAQKDRGSAEDKLFKALEEANRDKRLGTPSIIVIAGFGWNEADMRHAMLNGAVRIENLRDWLMLYFQYRKLKPNTDGLPERYPGQTDLFDGNFNSDLN